MCRGILVNSVENEQKLLGKEQNYLVSLIPRRMP